MKRRFYSLRFFLSVVFLAPGLWAQDLQEQETVLEEVHPYAVEREALGYDPEGIEYRRNRLEDFQVFFVTSLPFTGAVSFGLAALASKAFRGTFAVTEGYETAAIAGAVLGSLGVAWFSLPTSSASKSAIASGLVIGWRTRF